MAEKRDITIFIQNKHRVEVGVEEPTPKIYIFKTSKKFHKFCEKYNYNPVLDKEKTSFPATGKHWHLQIVSNPQEGAKKIEKIYKSKPVFLTKLQDKLRRSSIIAHLSFLWNWKNFFLCLKYPFWKSKNVWTGKFMGYQSTWYEDIPTGWRKAFGKQLSEDIKQAFLQDKKEIPQLKWKEALQWTQIKEKYGELCLYASATGKIRKVLDHYESISSEYCIDCGEPAKYLTKGYIIPLCSNCFDNMPISKSMQKDFPKKYLIYKRECRIKKYKRNKKKSVQKAEKQ